MSLYLEIPQLDPHFPYRLLLNDGMTIVYPHWHKEIEIIYAKQGRVNIGLDGEVITLEEGEMIYFSSGQSHYFLASPGSVRYVYQFDCKLFDEMFLRENEKDSLFVLFEEGENHSHYWPKQLARRIQNILLELFELEDSQQAGKNYLIYSLLYRLIGECYHFLPKKELEKNKKVPNTIQQKETLQRLNKVFDYIEMYYKEGITIDDVAQHVGFSPYYFTRFFKTNIGQTFMQFLTEYRIKQAQFILGNEKLPMAEVAENSGFTSVKTFHHVFKKVVGQSPLQYQKQMASLVSFE